MCGREPERYDLKLPHEFEQAMTNAALSAPLTAFSFVWASVTAIKTAAKLVARGEWRVSQPTVVLLLALAPSLLAPLSSAAWRGERARLVALAAGVGVHALVEGARSNHVLCELCLCASVMLSALHAIGHSGATASQERSAAMTSALRTGARAQVRHDFTKHRAPTRARAARLRIHARRSSPRCMRSRCSTR